MNERGSKPVGPPDPVFILAPPCTLSWVVCAILGEHPQMYALPELHLFTSESMSEWHQRSARASYDMDQGLLRAVAEIVFGAQTDAMILRARGWLVRREHLTTGRLLESILQRLAPLVAVERSPSVVSDIEAMGRMREMFPCARFLHLVSHPQLYGESVMQALAELSQSTSLAESHWLAQLANAGIHSGDGRLIESEPDPQWSWLSFHEKIVEFLDAVPDAQKQTVRGEEFSGSLGAILQWLDLRTDRDAMEMMRHPERSTYAGPGPSSAPYGSDIFVRAGPLFRPEWTDRRSLTDPVSWSRNGYKLSRDVEDLARSFGYQ